MPWIGRRRQFEVGGPDLRRSMRVRTLGPPTHDHRTAIGATVEPLPPWIFSGSMMKANS